MEKSIGRLVSILYRQSQVYINKCMKEYNITSAEHPFLLYLYKNEGISQDELSAYLYINKSATTRSIKSLEEKGYVIKKKDSLDKRINRIFLTSKARSHEEEIIRKTRCWSEFLAKDLDKETVETMLTVLQKMSDKVEQTNLKNELEGL
ncbi:MarR family transcriptional regulator [Alkalibaculum sp. M08DMB]|uniref:MarR family transcriptional regulator n=1 Tax=Alkalibaculum sporogenes TaxID=2655001 RepID=A0A6A7K740_9FIRM|nr:MarR family winged helix-turn-helix transcriptional regulator [Alkalibaculum sporogenes]MPW25151.1 MarR family transcriptional regulator [Alkalibaculum sporogenes]